MSAEKTSLVLIGTRSTGRTDKAFMTRNSKSAVRIAQDLRGNASQGKGSILPTMAG
jgi:hypothetical protein